MKLFDQQCYFTKDVAKLIFHAEKLGYECAMKEVQRTQEQADLYAAHGKGSKNSDHLYCLAVDIALRTIKDKIYLTKTEDYQDLGDYWESLNPKNYWGGYIQKRGGKIADGNHFGRHPE